MANRPKWFDSPETSKNEKVRLIRELVKGFIADNSQEIEFMYCWKCRLGFVFFPFIFWFTLLHLILSKSSDGWGFVAFGLSAITIFALFVSREIYSSQKKNKLKTKFYDENPWFLSFLRREGLHL